MYRNRTDMHHLTYIQKTLFAFLLLICLPLNAAAEQLQILQGDVSNAVPVAPGNSVIVESDKGIVEAVIANPGIADMNMESGSEVRLIGVTAGRTTLSLIDTQGNVSNIEVHVAANLRDIGRVAVPEMPRPKTTSVSLARTSNADVPSNGAIVIETDVPIAGIAFENPNIADGSMISDRSVYVLGKQLGSTTLSLTRNDTAKDTVITIRVTEYGDR